MRKLKLLIIVFVLFLLAALVGCKDEAEAVEPDNNLLRLSEAVLILDKKLREIEQRCVIPTWPDYIELEKTLIIREPANIREIAGYEHDFSVRIELAKGTKIYFKE